MWKIIIGLCRTYSTPMRTPWKVLEHVGRTKTTTCMSRNTVPGNYTVQSHYCFPSKYRFLRIMQEITVHIYITNREIKAFRKWRSKYRIRATTPNKNIHFSMRTSLPPEMVNICTNLLLNTRTYIYIRPLSVLRHSFSLRPFISTQKCSQPRPHSW